MKPETRLVKKESLPKLDVEKYNPTEGNPILQLIGKKISVVTRDGHTITGTIKRYNHGLIKLTEATVNNSKLTEPPTTLPWVLVDRTFATLLLPAE